MNWKINHVNWDSGFITLARPQNKVNALKMFEKLKGKYYGLITLYSPSGKKIIDYYTQKKSN